MARVHGAEMKRRSSHELSGLETALHLAQVWIQRWDYESGLPAGRVA